MSDERLAAEELTLRRLADPGRRDRLAAILRARKRRRELDRALAHGWPWDRRWALQVPVRQQNARDVERLLRERGAPDTCRLLGGLRDGEQLPLHEALDATIGASHGALVICIPGELAYYEGEDHDDRWLLARPLG